VTDDDAHFKEIRCQSKLHGILDERNHFIEMRCRSRFCGYLPGVVVIHRFSLLDWELVDTRVFRDPSRKEN
jgi:hypothetical protein